MPRIVTRLTPAMIAELTGGGWWPNETLGAVLRRQAVAAPGRSALDGADSAFDAPYRSSRGRFGPGRLGPTP